MRKFKTYVQLSLSVALLSFSSILQAQVAGPNAADSEGKEFPSDQGVHVFIDDKGVMRWSHDSQEVKGFGVNYSAPFAHAYRSAQHLGVDVKKAMEDDVYHFSRLGFDLFRMHIWDTQISDTLGNLLTNEHLDHFDYLVKLLKDQDIKMVLTPIAFWGSGWPEPDEHTPGFAHKYGKDGSLTHPDAIKAQQNYLSQFLNHVNPYTKLAYKDDPDVIAFEVSNEPHHREDPELVTEFIASMVEAMKGTGTQKPIFYNISHSVHLAQSYFDAGIDGGTFQWYPTGLMYGKELEGNLLPNVSSYEIPFDKVIRKNKGAKLVYEFDAADVLRSYIYPAMARSFREAGIQIATHFAYDPLFLAYANTEYNTHYMNLAYTPAKALSLMISGKVFHEIPMYKPQHAYAPQVEESPFFWSYPKDLAQYNSPDQFIYTNDTDTSPVAMDQLRQIAGVGNSPVVQYEGTGAYFLDKIEDGVWRLELMPDVFQVTDPFGTNSLERKVAVIQHNQRQMQVHLPDLNAGFQVVALSGKVPTATASDHQFKVSPGAYLLLRDSSLLETSYPGWDHKRLARYVAPDTDVTRTFLTHTSIPEISARSAAKVQASIASDEPVEKVEVWFENGNTYATTELDFTGGFQYEGAIPSEVLEEGYLQYRIIVHTPSGSHTYPEGKQGNPGQWDFKTQRPYTSRIVSSYRPVTLFDAGQDAADIVGPWKPGNRLHPTDDPGQGEYQVMLMELFTPDAENLDADPIYDYSFRSFVGDKLKGRKEDATKKTDLVLQARSLMEGPRPLQVALVMKDGSAYGVTLKLQPTLERYRIPIEALKRVPTVTLPRPFPTFLPYYLDHDLKNGLELDQVESVQFSIGPGLRKDQLDKPHAIGVQQVYLE